MAINTSDSLKSTKSTNVDFTPYRYAGETSVVRWRVTGRLSTSGTIADGADQTVMLAPNESIVWIFTP